MLNGRVNEKNKSNESEEKIFSFFRDMLEEMRVEGTAEVLLLRPGSSAENSVER
jgi:hypothetical protein